MEKYIERLFEEWKRYDKIIIAVDFDDTISPWGFSQEEIDATGIVYLLKRAQEVGAYIVCFTACNPDRFPVVREKFESIGVRLDSINANPIELPYGNQNKIYANIFLDDRAGLDESIIILSKAMWKYIGYKESKKMDDLDDIA